MDLRRPPRRRGGVLGPARDAVRESALDDPLEAQIDRRLERVAGDGGSRRELGAGNDRTGRVHDDALSAGYAAQVLVVLELEAVFPDHVVG